MKKVILNILLAFAISLCHAQGLHVSVPSHVQTGENFRLTYVIDTQDVGDLHLGGIPEALEVITGPYRSSQSSYQVINGHASSSSLRHSHIFCVPRKLARIEFLLPQ